jgi:predicted transcriptional regulator
MRRSKFEAYIDILKVLANKGPSKITHIMPKSNLNSNLLTKYLDFLINQEVVEERTSINDIVVFAITQKGVDLLKLFRKNKEVLPLVEEA